MMAISTPPADTTASNTAHNTPDVHATATRRQPNHVEQLTANPAAQYAGKRVPQCSQRELFHQSPSHIATHGATDQLNDER